MRALREDAGFGPNAQRRGKELRMLMELPLLDWPTDLSSRPLTIKQLMAEIDYTVPKLGRIPDPMKCTNPICPQRHNHAVSRVVGDHGNRRVLWYCNMRCRNMHLVDA